ncbi:hypothetical protein B566_EDAN017451 [Ephemera danica]|nr:hypothetical protein B566_EDAN017451 [Ephemera danica]
MEQFNEENVVVHSIDGVLHNVHDPETLADAAMLLDFALGDPMEHEETIDEFPAMAINSEVLLAADIHDIENSGTNEVKVQEQNRKRTISEMTKGNYLREVNKNKREKGEEYSSYSKIEHSLVKRPAKSCGRQCTAETCVKIKRACCTMAESERVDCFSTFWKLSQREKHVYVKGCVDFIPVKGHSGDPILSVPREIQNQYFVKEKEQFPIEKIIFLTDEAKKEDITKLSWPKFLELFHTKKLAIYVLQKDQCDSCAKFNLLVKSNTASEEDKEQHVLHVKEVKDSRDEKNRDKKLRPDLRNYSCFDLLISDVMCYLIQETEAGSDASVYASLLWDLVSTKKSRNSNLQNFTVWSDTCASQNRNQVLSNALLHLAIQLQIYITQKFLVPGHSQFEVDSTHSRIEKVTNNVELYSTEDYAEVIKKRGRLDESEGGRPGAHAYEVEIVTFEKFINFDKCVHYSSIRPGSKPGEPTVNKIRCLQYSPDGNIHYKLNMTGEWLPMPNKVKEPSCSIIKKYSEQLKISGSKYRDMLKLKQFVPSKYHDMYDKLPH